MNKNITNSRRGEFTLTIDGKDVNLLFNISFWKVLGDEGYKLEDLDKALGNEKGFLEMLQTISAIIYAGGLTYAKKNKTEFNYTKDDIFEWFEECIDEKVLENMFKVLMSTQLFGKTIGDNMGKNLPS